MVKSEEVVKKEIKGYIDRDEGSYFDWYVGVATDPKERLFVDHGVHEVGDLWIYRRCINSDVARRVEDYFVNDLGTDGGTGGGDEGSKHAYAYKKTTHSVE